MPAAPDHWQFCLKILGQKPGFSGPETLGTHGPDPFFFFGQVPWQKGINCSRVHDFAQWLHEAEPSAVFGPMVQAALDITHVSLRPLAFRFLKGFVYHYLLDRKIHPWVYWNAGFSTKNTIDPPSRIRHACFEASLATLGPVPQKQGEPYSQNPRIMLNSEKIWLSSADVLFLKAFPERYVSGMYEDSFYDMRTVLQCIWDPLGIKRCIFDVLGLHNSLPRSMIQPVINREFEQRDYRNSEHVQWLMPSTGTVQYESTGDLTQQALETALEAEKMIDDIEWDTGDSSTAGEKASAFVSFLGNLNHEGCAPGDEMKYWNKEFYNRSLASSAR